MNRRLWLIIALLLATGCAAPRSRPQLGREREISVFDGEEFFVSLQANEKAGYGWRLAQPPNPRVARVVSARFEQGYDIWTCEATGRGTTVIAWYYVKRADPQAAPVRIHRVGVEVR